MSWTIERRGRVAVVTMNTNKVNAQNRAFFADLHEAFDGLERDHAESPLVLTGQTRTLSAGFDLDEHFRLFAGDRDSVAAWFADYRATNMRLFTYPRPTVAAVNGHAYAGGLITAAVCDYRVAISDGRGSASTRFRSGSRCRPPTSACSPTRGANRSPRALACSARSSTHGRRLFWECFRSWPTAISCLSRRLRSPR